METWHRPYSEVAAKLGQLQSTPGPMGPPTVKFHTWVMFGMCQKVRKPVILF